MSSIPAIVRTKAKMALIHMSAVVPKFKCQEARLPLRVLPANNIAQEAWDDGQGAWKRRRHSDPRAQAPLSSGVVGRPTPFSSTNADPPPGAIRV